MSQNKPKHVVTSKGDTLSRCYICCPVFFPLYVQNCFPSIKLDPEDYLEVLKPNGPQETPDDLRAERAKLLIRIYISILDFTEVPKSYYNLEDFAI